MVWFAITVDLKWTYFDVLESEGDEKRSVVLDDTSVKGQL
jgi:hypothetical protein